MIERRESPRAAGTIERSRHEIASVCGQRELARRANHRAAAVPRRTVIVVRRQRASDRHPHPAFRAELDVDATTLMRRRRLSLHEERYGTHSQQCQSPEHLFSRHSSVAVSHARAKNYIGL